MELYKDFRFEAAHLLPKVPQGHKCARLHGHSYQVRITIEGEVNPETGWIMDFDVIKQAFEPLLEQLDHHYLNEVSGWKTPPASTWPIGSGNGLNLPCAELKEVEISETCDSGCRYRGA